MMPFTMPMYFAGGVVCYTFYVVHRFMPHTFFTYATHLYLSFAYLYHPARSPSSLPEQLQLQPLLTVVVLCGLPYPHLEILPVVICR